MDVKGLAQHLIGQRGGQDKRVDIAEEGTETEWRGTQWTEEGFLRDTFTRSGTNIAVSHEKELEAIDGFAGNQQDGSVTQAEAERFYASLDRDGDGKLSETEQILARA